MHFSLWTFSQEASEESEGGGFPAIARSGIQTAETQSLISLLPPVQKQPLTLGVSQEGSEERSLLEETLSELRAGKRRRVARSPRHGTTRPEPCWHQGFQPSRRQCHIPLARRSRVARRLPRCFTAAQRAQPTARGVRLLLKALRFLGEPGQAPLGVVLNSLQAVFLGSAGRVPEPRQAARRTGFSRSRLKKCVTGAKVRPGMATTRVISTKLRVVTPNTLVITAPARVPEVITRVTSTPTRETIWKQRVFLEKTRILKALQRVTSTTGRDFVPETHVASSFPRTEAPATQPPQQKPDQVSSLRRNHFSGSTVDAATPKPSQTTTSSWNSSQQPNRTASAITQQMSASMGKTPCQAPGFK